MRPAELIARTHVINLPGLSTSPISAAQVLNGVIYTSGQVGRDPIDRHVPGDLIEQIRLAMDTLQVVLTEAGGSLATVVKTTVYLTRQQDFAAMNTVYATYFPGTKPARSTVIVTLADPTLLFEIEAVAYQESEKGDAP